MIKGRGPEALQAAEKRLALEIDAMLKRREGTATPSAAHQHGEKTNGERSSHTNVHDSPRALRAGVAQSEGGLSSKHSDSNGHRADEPSARRAKAEGGSNGSGARTDRIANGSSAPPDPNGGSIPPASNGARARSDDGRFDEARLSAAARALAPHSAAVRNTLVETTKCLVKRGEFEREMYAACVRALTDANDKRVSALLRAALTTEEAGGLASLSAACFVDDVALAVPLARAASSSKTQICFGAEVARLCRGELSGARLSSLAPKVKEAHRISLCIDLLLPITGTPSVPGKACAPIADALHVLRAAERHLGRWLVMAEIAHRSGDGRPLREALEKSSVGPQSSRAAWSFVAWALEPSSVKPTARPTSETVARLSHRPSADKDMGFLFRLGEAAVPAAEPMLEQLAKLRPLADGVALRAAFVLARRYGHTDLVGPIKDVASTSTDEGLRGLAAVALFDLGERTTAIELSRHLALSTSLEAQVWAALVSVAAGRSGDAILDEPTFRRVHWGWVE